MDSMESQMEMLSLENHKRDVKWIKHYSSTQKILLVGEGDFSFAASLAQAFGSACNMIATSLYSQGTMMHKYGRGGAKNLRKLEEFGCVVIHGVDARSMNKHPLLCKKLFDRIVYNFPHTALKQSEANIRQIESHKRLVKGFMRSASTMLEEKGEIHVTHKITQPYSNWEIEKLAGDAGLVLVEKVRFRKSDYPGYQNTRGSGPRAAETFPAGNCCTFKFARTCTTNQWLINYISSGI